MYYFFGECEDQNFNKFEIKKSYSLEKIRFIKRILIFGKTLVRFSENYSKIIAFKKFENDINIEDNTYFQSQNKWLAIQIDKSIHILDIEDLQIKFMINNFEEID